jgi:hypothetical protein
LSRHSHGDSYVTSGAAAAVLQRKATAIVNVARLICARSYHFGVACGEQKGQNPSVKYWELIADKLSKAG